MARIEGVFLPKDKRVEYGLTYIFGIGLFSSREILKKTGINLDTRVKDLSSQDVASIQKEITASYRVEGDLRKDITLDIKRLQEINSYRGLRHKRSLPARGQRTSTNARTRKGPKRASNAITNKKVPGKK